jgi:thiol-disulfide isomerase/thioredoxin
LNGEPSEANGPVLVHFWSVSCHLCHENMPEVREWKRRFEPLGLRFVAVHMPRQESDTQMERIQEMLSEMGVDEPCAVDNTLAVSDEFQNTFVPAYFLFDAEGRLKSRSAGANGIRLLGPALERMFEPVAA